MMIHSKTHCFLRAVRETALLTLGILIPLGPAASGQTMPPATRSTAVPTTQPTAVQPTATQPEITLEAQQIENEMIDVVVRQTFGPYTVDDLALPKEFLQRVSDRAFRAAYEKQFRIVVADRTTTSPSDLSANVPAAGGAGLGTPAAIILAVVVVVAVGFGLLRNLRREQTP